MYDPKDITYMKDKINELNNDSIYSTYIRNYKNKFIKNIPKIEQLTDTQCGMILSTIQTRNIIDFNYSNTIIIQDIKKIFDILYRESSIEPSAPPYTPQQNIGPPPSAPTYR